MPALYGITSNANVSVANTPGLYIGSGNVLILNSAQTLDSLLSNQGNVNFALTSDNSQVYAYYTGQSLTYSNANVAAYLPTYTGTLGFGSGFSIGNFAAQSIYIGNQPSSPASQATSLGYNAGYTNQGLGSTAVGANAGGSNQGQNSIAIGNQAGSTNQGQIAVAVGANAGNNGQGLGAVAIGVDAGYINQGTNSIAIGNSAGAGNNNYQANNTIILNATGSEFDGNPGQTNSFYVNPIRNDSGNVAQTLYYNPTTKEITYYTTAVSSTYSNSNVAAYLAANTDPTIQNLNANTQQQQTQINSVTANLTAFETYANVTYSTIANAASQETEITSLRGNITAANAAIQTLSANLGSFETYANVTFVTTANASTYSNANVASYLSSGLVTTINTTGNITTTANVVATGNLSANNATVTNKITAGSILSTGNITANTGAYFIGDGSQLTNLPTQAGTYSNTNVAAYLSGNITTGNITNTGVIVSTGNITAPNFLGTAQYFSGNLAGNILYNGTTGANGIAANTQAFNGVAINPIQANAWSVFQTAGAVGTVSPNVAVFSNLGGVQTVTTAGVTASMTQSNVLYSTKSGTVQVLLGGAVQGQYFLANSTMNSNDRVNHFGVYAEAFLQGQGWGYNSSGYPGNYQPPSGSSGAQFAAQKIASSYAGYGNVGAQIGLQNVTTVAPTTAGAINVNYQTAYQAVVGYGSWASGAQPNSYIDIARAFYPTGNFGNTTQGVQNITNLYGLHVIKYWENNGSAGRTVPNKRVIQNEDPNTDIFNAGNVFIGGNVYNTSGNVFMINSTSNVIVTSLPTTVNANLTVGSASNHLLTISNYTAATIRSIVGSVGQMVAVNDNGGQIAYWDTTNTRWSYINGGGAV